MTARPLKKSSRRQMQKEETRRIILATAYSLFGSKGFEKTTMRELAERADVGLGTIFKHFPDKRSLLVSAFQEDIEAVIQNSLDTMPVSNIKIQLAHIASELYEFFGLNLSFSRALIQEALFLQESPGDILGKQVLSFLEKIEKIIRGAIDRAELDRQTDYRSDALSFMSFFLLGLILGVRGSAFDVKKQTLFLGSILDNHFSKTFKQIE